MYCVNCHFKKTEQEQGALDLQIAGVSITSELSNVIIKSSEMELYDKIIKTILDDYKDKCCRRVIGPYMEEGNFLSNYIRVELFLKQYSRAIKSFKGYVKTSVLDEVLSINENCKDRTEKHLAIINNKIIVHINELIEKYVSELKEMEDML